jgi:hypothetical protein
MLNDERRMLNRVVEPDLWSLTSGQPEIDPDRLAAAVEREALSDGFDFRTRLLIRDSTQALFEWWGPERFDSWLSVSPAKERIVDIRAEELGPPGFPTLGARLIPQTPPETILQWLRELGSRTSTPTRAYIGGTSALILFGRISRHCDHIDFVDSVPGQAQRQYPLPIGWQARTHPLGQFGPLETHLVDPLDVFLDKLFSSRSKDRDDLRSLRAGLDKSNLQERLRRDAFALLSEPRLREAAVLNWYVLYGEPLPS